jgi:hypothetical protein
LATVEVYKRSGKTVDADPQTPGDQPEATRYEYDLVGNLLRERKPNGVVADHVDDSLVCGKFFWHAWLGASITWKLRFTHAAHLRARPGGFVTGRLPTAELRRNPHASRAAPAAALAAAGAAREAKCVTRAACSWPVINPAGASPAGTLSPQASARVQNRPSASARESCRTHRLNRLDVLREFLDNNGNGVFDAGDDLLTRFDYTVRADGRRTGAVEQFWIDGAMQQNTIDSSTRWTIGRRGAKIGTRMNLDRLQVDRK